MIRQINTKFKHNGIDYQVVKSDFQYPYKCVYCGFFDHVSLKCRGTLSVTGDCIRRWRNGSEEVIFKEL